MCLKTSPAGRRYIGRKEGLRLVAYRDIVGVWTIGYGHTSRAGPPEVRPGMRITRAEADAILARDLGIFEDAVRDALPGVPLAQHEFDALVSLCLNIGGGNFARSTVVRRLKAGDRRGAADAMRMWRYAGGRVIRGLVLRRAAERRLFLTGRYEEGVAQAGMAGLAGLLDLLNALPDLFRRLAWQY